MAISSEQVEDAKLAIEGEGKGLETRTAEAIGEVYVRKLRRTLVPLALDIGEQGKGAVERKLFASVYKGVTDIVTKYAWPEPAFWLTRGAAALGMSATGAHLREGLVARCVEEGDLRLVGQADLIGTDMLGNAPGLA